MSQSLLGFKGLKEITNIHPVFVHFPIALYPVTLLYYAVGVFGDRPDFLTTARITLYLAALSGVITAVSGLKARSSISFTETLGRMVKTHQGIGVSIFALSIVLALWSFFQEQGRPKGDIAFLIALVFMNYLVLQNADIGSLMVYTQGGGVKIDRSTGGA